MRERLQEFDRRFPRCRFHSKRLSRNETRFQWVEGATMPADVLTKGKERGHVELMRKLLLLGIKSVLPPRCWRKEDDKLVNASYCDTKNADEKHI